MSAAAAFDPALVETPCPRCGLGSDRTVLIGKDHLHGIAGAYKVGECARCGLWFLNPRPRSDQLSLLYPDDYGPHVASEPPKRSTEMLGYLASTLGYAHLTGSHQRSSWRSSLDRMRMRWKVGVGLTPYFVPDGAVLEIGAASGLRLAGLRDLGWTNLHGIELVSGAAEKARAQGFQIVCGAVEDSLDQYPDESFDVIVTSMVLEHLVNPFEVVRAVGRKLKPRGQFLFSTITRDALDAKIYGPYWGGFDFPRHLVFLRNRDIAAMIQDDFETEESFHHNAPQDFVRSSQWRKPEGRWLDRAVLALTNPVAQYRAGLFLAWAGQTCRVSYRCRKKH